MNIDQAWRRYNNDAAFNQLVKTFYQFMHKMQFTHEDLRSAAFLAAVQIEQNKPAPYVARLQSVAHTALTSSGGHGNICIGYRAGNKTTDGER